jgi:hypothetical protein
LRHSVERGIAALAPGMGDVASEPFPVWQARSEELLRVHSVFPDSRKFLCFIPDPERVFIFVDRRPSIGIPIGLVIAGVIWLVTLK